MPLHIGLAFVLGLFVGANLGVGLMCLFQVNAPSADDAIFCLSRLFWLVDNANTCDFTNGVTCGTIDEGTVVAAEILATAERFLRSVADPYVTDTRT